MFDMTWVVWKEMEERVAKGHSVYRKVIELKFWNLLMAVATLIQTLPCKSKLNWNRTHNFDPKNMSPF